MLTVTINGANDAPVGVDDTSASAGATAATEKGGTLNGSGGTNATGNVITNDTDVDSGSLTVSAIRTGGTEGAGTAGTVGVGLVGAHGTLTIAVQRQLHLRGQRERRHGAGAQHRRFDHRHASTTRSATAA